VVEAAAILVNRELAEWILNASMMQLRTSRWRQFYLELSGCWRCTASTSARHSVGFPHCKIFVASAPPGLLLDLTMVPQGGSMYVDLVLRLDVLVVCAVFAFVGAILLGAF
jgi:hypothetical protein